MGAREPHRREPPDGLLLHNRCDAVVAGAKTVNQRFSFRIARQSDRQIGVSRKPRFRTRGNGQTANQGEGDVGFSEVGVDLA
jgi:hypothetical protein